MNHLSLRKKESLHKKVSDSLKNRFHKMNHLLTNRRHPLSAKRNIEDRQVHPERIIDNPMILWEVAVARRAMELKKKKIMTKKWTHRVRMSRWIRSFRRNLNESRKILETIAHRDNTLNLILFTIKIVV